MQFWIYEIQVFCYIFTAKRGKHIEITQKDIKRKNTRIKQLSACGYYSEYIHVCYCLVCLRSSPHLLVRSLLILSMDVFVYFSSQHSVRIMKYTKNKLVWTSLNAHYLLKIAVLIVELIPELAEHAASLLGYQMEMRARIRPVGKLLLLCSACSRSTYLI